VRPNPPRYEASRPGGVLYVPAIRWRKAARFSALHEARGPGSAAKATSATINNIGRFEWRSALGYGASKCPRSAESGHRRPMALTAAITMPAVRCMPGATLIEVCAIRAACSARTG
jgi:hypothetical protein